MDISIPDEAYFEWWDDTKEKNKKLIRACFRHAVREVLSHNTDIQVKLTSDYFHECSICRDERNVNDV